MKIDHFFPSFLLFLGIPSTITFRSFAVFADNTSNKFDKIDSLHNNASIIGLDYTNLLSNCLSCYQVISCYHSDGYSCNFTFLNCVWDFFSRNIFDSDDSQAYKLRFLDLKDTFIVLSV